MDTRNIVLQEITMREFEAVEKEWGSQRRKQGDHVYSLIQNPVQSVDYEQLINEIASLPFYSELHVRDGKDWIKKKVSELTKNDVVFLAKTAASDYVKRNYFHWWFRPKEMRRDRAVMEFVEKGGLIIGYKISVPYMLSHMFDTVRSTENRYYYNQAIWSALKLSEPAGKSAP